MRKGHIARFLERDAELTAALEDDTHYDGDFDEPLGDSLNAGLELEGEERQVVVPDEKPVDLTEECASLESMTDRIQDLLYLATDVEKSGGMCKGFALEAQKLLPGFGGVSVAHYSEAPSATRYKAALEEITAGMWGMIAAAAAALIAMLWKVYKWISGDKTDGEIKGKPGDAKAAAQAVEKQADAAGEAPAVVEQVGDTIQEGEQLLKDSDIMLKDKNGHEYRATSFQVVIDKSLYDEERYARAKKFLETRDPLYHDIINAGPYSKTMTAVGEKLGQLKASLKMKFDALDEIARMDLSNHSNRTYQHNKNALDSLTKQPISLNIEGREYNLSELAQHVQKVRSDMEGRQVNHSIHFDNMFKTISTALRQRNVQHILMELATGIESMGELEARLKKLEDVTRDLSTDGAEGASTQDIGPYLREVLRATHRDIAGFAAIVVQVRYYAKGVADLTKETVGFGKEIVRLIVGECEKSGKEIPKGWKGLRDDLNKQLKAIEQAYHVR